MSNVNNVKAKGTPIVLCDGVKRELKYTLNALAEIEDRYGSVDEGFKKLDEGSIKAIRFILWAGLLHSDESLTEQQVGALLDIQRIKEISESLAASFTADMPEKDDTVPNE